MNKEKYLQFIASFLAVLVMAIPFYTTSVYAAINKISAKGSDGIEGFARPEDFVNLEVQASIPDDTITPDQVVLGLDPSIQFDKCTAAANNSFVCTLRFPGSGTESFEIKSFPFTINLFKDDKTLEDAKSGTLTIDNKAPEVKLSASKGKFSSQENVVVNYDIADFACDDSSCAGKCSGIKSIEFFTLGNSFNQKIDIASGNCSFSSNISIDSKIFDNGLNSVFAKATDKFGKVSADASATFIVDNSGPLILQDSFRIIRNDVSISTFTSSGVDVDVFVNISGNDLNLNSVTADLSALNPSQNLKNAKASCSKQDDASTCKWAIELKPNTGGLKNIVINASDTSGNKESIAISKLLSIDEQGPIVQSLLTSASADGQLIGKKTGNTVTAAFEDATGLSTDDAILHVDGSEIKAASCNKESNWVCTWENVNFGFSAKISIEADTTDVLGNSVVEEMHLDVKVDQDTPQLKSINISPVGGLTQAFPGFFKIGDKIAVVANVTEDNDVFASADFSKFISGASNVAGQCERQQADEHICTWLTGLVNLESSDFVAFNFSDNAGNTLIVTRSLKTFGLENATVPDFWASDVECSPDTIDRSLGPLINQRVFCQINLRQKSTTKAVSTVFIGPASCSGDTSIVDNVDTFNTEPGTKSPVIKITLKKDDFKINNASLSCSFSIFSKIGSSTDITKNPEIENAKISLLFSNLPLGEISSEVQRKIKDAKDDAKGIFKLIGTLNKLVTIAKKICQLINTIYTILASLYLAYFVIKGVEFDCVATFGTTGILASLCGSVYSIAVGQCNAQEAANIKADTIKSATDTFCSYVNCKQTILWGPTMQQWFNDLPFPISPGQYVGVKTEIKGEGFFGQEVKPVSDGKEKTYYDYLREKPYGLKPISAYMDPQHNLIVATLFACLPGIIYGLDKYRQIKCLYADCLENSVGKEGLPVTACEDLKAFSTCKYVYGELFAVFPWTAVFDHFTGLIKNSLSNPFSAIGVAIALACPAACKVPADGGAAYKACRGFRLLALVGDAAANVKNIIDEGFKVRQDYCSRLDLDKDEKKAKAATGTSGFTQVKAK